MCVECGHTLTLWELQNENYFWKLGIMPISDVAEHAYGTK